MDVVHIFANVLTILSLVAAISGLLTLIGRGHLTLQLTLPYILPPLSLSPSARDMALFRLLTSSPCLILIQGECALRFAGLQVLPCPEIMRVLALLVAKLVENEFAAVPPTPCVNDIAECPVDTWVHDRFVRAVGFANNGCMAYRSACYRPKVIREQGYSNLQYTVYRLEI